MAFALSASTRGDTDHVGATGGAGVLDGGGTAAAAAGVPDAIAV